METTNQQVLIYDKDCPFFLFYTGMFVKTGLLSESGRVPFDEAIENAPDQGKFYSERGRAKNLKGDKAGAFEDLKKSIELNPEGEEAKLVEGSHSNFDNLYKGGLY